MLSRRNRYSRHLTLKREGPNLLLGANLPSAARPEGDGVASATGALRGAQNRAWVTCRIPALSFQSTLIAIITEAAAQSLTATGCVRPDLQKLFAAVEAKAEK